MLNNRLSRLEQKLGVDTNVCLYGMYMQGVNGERIDGYFNSETEVVDDYNAKHGTNYKLEQFKLTAVQFVDKPLDSFIN